MISNFQIVINYTTATTGQTITWQTDTAVNLISGLGLTQNNMAVWFIWRSNNTSGQFFSATISSGSVGTGVSIFPTTDFLNSGDLIAVRRTSSTTVELNQVVVT
jgi:hypothetical protein